MAIHDFQRIAIVNRGEPAMRFILAAREYNHENNASLQTVALYTEPDRKAMFVREANHAYDLGPATSVDERDGLIKSTYVNYGKLKEALLAVRAEAVWVGWGFVAEHAGFADMCAELGIVFIGPNGDVMRRLGDKISAKRLAEEADVPVAPWSKGPVSKVEDAIEHGKKLGYPLMLKATAGGGGRGIRKITEESELEEAMQSAGTEALKAFGDGTLFMEKMVTGARHVEVQVIADSAGNVWTPGVRDCSVQRRNQKVIEESPSPGLTPEQQQNLCAAAGRLAKTMGYQNAGTVEFLYDPANKSFSFMEVNARLQVEHPVTEMTTGIDLVKLQIHVARGGHLEGEAPRQVGHAIEARLNAEDAEAGFTPAPGEIAYLRLPKGPGIRIDIGVEEGDVIPPDFDSMVGKIIAHGSSREEAMARLRRAVAGCSAVVRGGTTNKGFLMQLLSRREVQTGELDIAWLDRLVKEGGHVSHWGADVALIQAGIEACEDELAVERAQFLVSAARGRPEMSDEVGHNIELGYQGDTYKLNVARFASDQYRITIDGQRLDVRRERLGELDQCLWFGEQKYRVLSLVHGVTNIVEVEGVPHRVSRDKGGVVRSPSPAMVISVAVKEGDEVAEGDRLAVLEAMKTEILVNATSAGRVREVMITSNVQVAPGAPMMIIEPTEEESVEATTERVNFEALATVTPQDEDASHAYLRRLEELKGFVLGFDVPADELQSLVAQTGTLTAGLETEAYSSKMIELEDEILTTFVDICSLVRRRRDIADGDDVRFSTQEYLHTYLRDLTLRGEGLPTQFVDKLRQVLSHYGVDELDPCENLERSLFRIYRAQQRADAQVPSVLSILQHRLENVDELSTGAGSDFRRLLDRLAFESEGRFRLVNDFSRELRYRYYEQPLLETAVNEVYAKVEADLEALSGSSISADARTSHIQSLVSCPQHLRSRLVRRFESANPQLQGAMLEALLRRFYSIRDIENVKVRGSGNCQFATADYPHENGRVFAVAGYAKYSELRGVAESLLPILGEHGQDCDVTLDFFVRSEDNSLHGDVVAEELRELLSCVGFKRPIRRVVVAITTETKPAAGGHMLQFTFRQSDGGFTEERRYRGLHPMVGKRMCLWRLDNFDIERLPSVEDVYLFRATAKENDKDKRIIALAEVRDLTPLREDDGQVVGLPLMERTLHEAFTSIRRVQSKLGARGRLHWNRVQVFVRPVFNLPRDMTNGLVKKLAPAASGAGLQTVRIWGQVPNRENGELRDIELDISDTSGTGVAVRQIEPPTEPMKPLDEYTRRVVSLRRRGLVYPYEIIKTLAPSGEGVESEFPRGEFQEYDLNDEDKLIPVDRAPGMNSANLVVGVIRNFTERYPEGISRVVLLGDASRNMGSLARPECSRIAAALDLAEEMQVPLEWFTVSAGAKISMDSGVENMDWIGVALRRIVNFTQAGGEINVVVCGVNVGAQPYWNAEATMLMHTKGILIMSPDVSMVLTGKQALDYSGGVSAEDNVGIGGYDRIMGPNGEAQYFAPDINGAMRLLLQHYDYTYVAPGERFPRPFATSDTKDRSVSESPHGGDFPTVGDVFSETTNPGRKRPFKVRKVMRAVADQDAEPMERWFGMRDAEIAVVWHTTLGGQPVCLMGLESTSLRRLGVVPSDGPDHWTAGTLFPVASKKVARGINAASGKVPLVILANLSGFDGSPESLRKVQLEYGAEIGRAVVNFKGPIIFCVISRYHGGAFVVFSNRLNDNMEASALEGAHASVIGGAPAAAVVFAREVAKRTKGDAAVQEIEQKLAAAQGADKVKLRAQREQVWVGVHSEKLGQVAEEFDAVHSVHRAKEVGSVHHIVPAAGLRTYLIDAVERGMKKALEIENVRDDA